MVAGHLALKHGSFQRLLGETADVLKSLSISFLLAGTLKSVWDAWLSFLRIIANALYHPNLPPDSLIHKL